MCFEAAKRMNMVSVLFNHMTVVVLRPASPDGGRRPLMTVPAAGHLL